MLGESKFIPIHLCLLAPLEAAQADSEIELVEATESRTAESDSDKWALQQEPSAVLSKDVESDHLARLSVTEPSDIDNTAEIFDVKADVAPLPQTGVSEASAHSVQSRDDETCEADLEGEEIHSECLLKKG